VRYPVLYFIVRGTVPNGVVDVTRSPGLLSHPAETVPAQHRMQHAIMAQREAAAARRLDITSMSSCSLSPGRTLGGTRGWRLGMPPRSQIRSQAVGLLRTQLPSASAWCVRGAASSARCSSPIWVWIAQRLRLRAFWALRSRDTAAGVSGSSSMPEVGRSSACRCPAGTGGATLARGGALGAGGGRVGFAGAASSESAAGSGRLRAPAAVESAAASVVALTCGVCVLVGGFGWL
jgi:hypothetical protein